MFGSIVQQFSRFSHENLRPIVRKTAPKMNRAQVANLLDEVRKSPDKGTVYRRLVRVRTEVINTEAGTQHFVALDGVRLLVGLLAKPHEKVLEVVLSILGNCCMRKECAKQVGWVVLGLLLIFLHSREHPTIKGALHSM